MFRYESPAHFSDVFWRYYGPTQRAFGALDPEGQAALTGELHLLIEQFCGPTSGRSAQIPAEYWEVLIRPDPSWMERWQRLT